MRAIRASLIAAAAAFLLSACASEAPAPAPPAPAPVCENGAYPNDARQAVTTQLGAREITLTADEQKKLADLVANLPPAETFEGTVEVLAFENQEQDRVLLVVFVNGCHRVHIVVPASEIEKVLGRGT